MTSRLQRDRRPLVTRNAAVAGAHRLTVVGQLGLVALAAGAAAIVGVPIWQSSVAMTEPWVGTLVTAVLIIAAAASVWWALREGRAPQDRRALLAVTVTAVATEVLLRGLALGLLDAAGSPVTVAVLLSAVATGLLQACRATPGSRAYGLVLATVFGFVLGLVVIVSGSVLAAAALHVVVNALGLARTMTAATSAAAAGCACGGHDHDHSAAPTSASSQPEGNLEPADHASCSSSCEHAGSAACAVCPLSRV